MLSSAGASLPDEVSSGAAVIDASASSIAFAALEPVSSWPLSYWSALSGLASAKSVPATLASLVSEKSSCCG